MTIKLRRRRSVVSGLDQAAELKAWSMTFAHGRDYFSDLRPLGIDQRTDEKPDFLEKADEAWSRLGALFLMTWVPRPGRLDPWALDTFGDPS